MGTLYFHSKVLRMKICSVLLVLAVLINVSKTVNINMDEMNQAGMTGSISNRRVENKRAQHLWLPSSPGASQSGAHHLTFWEGVQKLAQCDDSPCLIDCGKMCIHTDKPKPCSQKCCEMRCGIFGRKRTYTCGGTTPKCTSN